MKCRTSYLNCFALFSLAGFLVSVNALAQLEPVAVSPPLLTDEVVTAVSTSALAGTQQEKLNFKKQLAASFNANRPPAAATGSVRLIATRDNHPSFTATDWSLYRLEDDKRYKIGEYQRHARQLELLPGVYEAVAVSDTVVRARKFWVRGDTIHNVTLAMD